MRILLIVVLSLLAAACSDSKTSNDFRTAEDPAKYLEGLYTELLEISEVEFERWGLLPFNGIVEAKGNVEPGPEFGVVHVQLTEILKTEGLAPSGLVLEWPAFQVRVRDLALLLLEEITIPRAGDKSSIEFKLLSADGDSATVRVIYEGNTFWTEDPPPYFFDLQLMNTDGGWKLDLSKIPLPTFDEPEGLHTGIEHSLSALRSWHGLDASEDTADEWIVSPLKASGFQASGKWDRTAEAYRTALRESATQVVDIRVTGWVTGWPTENLWPFIVTAVETHETPQGRRERRVLYDILCRPDDSEAMIFVYYRP